MSELPPGDTTAELNLPDIPEEIIPRYTLQAINFTPPIRGSIAELRHNLGQPDKVQELLEHAQQKKDRLIAHLQETEISFQWSEVEFWETMELAALTGDSELIDIADYAALWSEEPLFFENGDQSERRTYIVTGLQTSQFLKLERKCNFTRAIDIGLRGQALWHQGRKEEAEPLLREANNLMSKIIANQQPMRNEDIGYDPITRANKRVDQREQIRKERGTLPFSQEAKEAVEHVHEIKSDNSYGVSIPYRDIDARWIRVGSYARRSSLIDIERVEEERMELDKIVANQFGVSIEEMDAYRTFTLQSFFGEGLG